MSEKKKQDIHTKNCHPLNLLPSIRGSDNKFHHKTGKPLHSCLLSGLGSEYHVMKHFQDKKTGKLHLQNTDYTI